MCICLSIHVYTLYILCVYYVCIVCVIIRLGDQLVDNALAEEMNVEFRK